MSDLPPASPDAKTPDSRWWFQGITSYQWLVLLIASLGWVFDVFEGQIFVASMNKAMPELAGAGASPSRLDLLNKLAFGAFLIGGAVGGIGFGFLSDLIGRTRTLTYTILMYSLFTCLTFFAQKWWQLIALRFLVALGVGGEWAVATTLVAEVFPKRARAWSLAIFHASSVFGTYLAVLTRWLLYDLGDLNWRWGFLVGGLPALLTVWIRLKLKEPERWVKAKRQKGSRLNQLVGSLSSEGMRRAAIGVTLATIGLTTFWGIHIYGKDLMRHAAERSLAVDDAEGASLSADALAERAKTVDLYETLGMFLTTTGGGLGLIAFGPLCEWLGRRRAFLWFHVGGFLVTWGLLYGMPDATPSILLVMLPLFGFMTLGMHAGYAVYFPELFPTAHRGTGAGVCFNGGRVASAGILVLAGWLGAHYSWSIETTALWISGLFLLGIPVLLFAPETKGRELDE